MRLNLALKMTMYFIFYFNQLGNALVKFPFKCYESVFQVFHNFLTASVLSTNAINITCIKPDFYTPVQNMNTMNTIT